MLGSQRRSVFLYLDECWESEKADLKMDSRNDLSPPGFEGPFGICRGVAPHPPCFLSPFLPQTLLPGFLQPCNGHMGHKSRILGLGPGLSLRSHVTSLGFEFVTCKMRGSNEVDSTISWRYYSWRAIFSNTDPHGSQGKEAQTAFPWNPWSGSHSQKWVSCFKWRL